MIVLGIETSTSVCSVGIAREGESATAERSILESHIHSEKLLTLIQEVCRDAKVRLQDVDGVAVSLGPGSFTGLRIGMSAAKGLSYALDKPLLAVPTFEAVAQAASRAFQSASRVVVCVDAKQGEFYVGTFVRSEGSVRAEGDVNIQTLRDLSNGNLDASDVVVTDRLKEVQQACRTAMTKEIYPFCRGDVVASIAMRKLSSGRGDDLASLEPAYLKDFVVRVHET